MALQPAPFETVRTAVVETPQTSELGLLAPLQVPAGPELIIVGLIFLVVPFVVAYWVYNDATDRGNDNAALWAVAVGGLMFLTFFGGLLALVVYFWQRE
ncbi:MAG: hypothetical protein PPP58_11380 [Natronomonas sp.]